MSEAIFIAMIEAVGTVLAALITAFSAYRYLIRRQDVISLTRNVESYHKLVGGLVMELLQKEGKINQENSERVESLVRFHRGSYRKKYIPEMEKLMTGIEAQKIRRKYFGPD